MKESSIKLDRKPWLEAKPIKGFKPYIDLSKKEKDTNENESKK